MTAWILSILGTGVIGALIDHLTSGTKAHKAVKTACIYAFVLAVIFPVPMIISGNFESLSCNFDGDVVYDDQIADITDDAYFSLVSEALDTELKNNGYDTKSEAEGTIYSSIVTLTRVNIFLYGEFADSSSEILRIKKLASEYLDTSAELIYVYLE